MYSKVSWNKITFEPKHVFTRVLSFVQHVNFMANLLPFMVDPFRTF